MGQNLSILLYSSQKQASVGDIVEINIRNNVDFGLILSENLEVKKRSIEAYETLKTYEDSNLSDEIFHSAQDDEVLKDTSPKNFSTNNEIKKFEIKEINRILPIKLTNEQIQFLKIFSDNTFNSLNDTWDALTMPFGLLTQKQWLELENISESCDNNIDTQIIKNNSQATNISNNLQTAQNEHIIEDIISTDFPKNQVSTNTPIIAPEIEFLIDFDIKVRIMYIIRSLISTFQAISGDSNSFKSNQLLIVFPEKKYLNKIHKYLQSELDKVSDFKNNIELLYYASEPTKKPKECVWSMLKYKNTNIDYQSKLNSKLPTININNSFKIQIICSTRSGLFLPFTNLRNIILVDEGNSMYIQDQNSLYYDTREAVFLISKAFKANISFISPLPSVRLHSMYNNEVLKEQMTKHEDIIQKPRKIKITRFDKKSSKYDLFGYEIEQILES